MRMGQSRNSLKGMCRPERAEELQKQVLLWGVMISPKSLEYQERNSLLSNRPRIQSGSS